MGRRPKEACDNEELSKMITRKMKDSPYPDDLLPAYRIVEKYPMLTMRTLSNWRKRRKDGDTKNTPPFYCFVDRGLSTGYYSESEFDEFIKKKFVRY